MRTKSIKNNIDRKILKFLTDDKMSFGEIIKKLNVTSDNFKKIQLIDSGAKINSVRKEMIEEYLALSEKRINDMLYIQSKTEDNEFFAGITDLDCFNLIKLRDSVSYEVVSEEV